MSSPPIDPGRRHARDAAVLRRQAAVSRRDPVLPHGRLLRDVLRGRADRGARPRADADLALQGRQRRRHSDVRRALSRRRRLRRAAGAQGLPRRHLRADGGSEEGQGRRPPRGGPRRVARHADRCQLSRCARTGVPDGARAGRRTGPATASRCSICRPASSRPPSISAPTRARRCSTSWRCCGRARSSRPPDFADAGGDDRDAAPDGGRSPTVEPWTFDARSGAARAARAAADAEPRSASASRATRPRSAPPARSSSTCATRRRPISRTSARSRSATGADCLIDRSDHAAEPQRDRVGRRRPQPDRCCTRSIARVTSMGGRLLRTWLLQAAAVARADPGSARRGRGVRLPQHRARQGAGHAAARSTTWSGWSRARRSAPPGRAIWSRCASRWPRCRACGCCSTSCARRSSAAWSPSSTISPICASDLEATLLDEPPALARDGGAIRDGVDRRARRAARHQPLRQAAHRRDGRGRARPDRHRLAEDPLQPRVRLLHRDLEVEPRQRAGRLPAQADDCRRRALHHAGAEGVRGQGARRRRADPRARARAVRRAAAARRRRGAARAGHRARPGRARRAGRRSPRPPACTTTPSR